jgi:hypothetical protein
VIILQDNGDGTAQRWSLRTPEQVQKHSATFDPDLSAADKKKADDFVTAAQTARKG